MFTLRGATPLAPLSSIPDLNLTYYFFFSDLGNDNLSNRILCSIVL